MAKKKFYAVRVGKVPGIYQTWAQAEEQVKGFSSAEYKSFSTEKDAIEYLSCKEVSEKEGMENNVDEINNKIAEEIKELQDDEAIAFVDGSYHLDNDSQKEKYSFGAYIITNKSENSLYKSFVNETYMDSRNIAGEIEGVKQAILWSVESKKRRIKIFYDYEGIEKWAEKEWKANKRVSKDYLEFINEYSKLIKIEFQHVKAHTGIIYNEKADELAKKALLSQGYKSYNDGSIYFIGLEKKDWINIIDELNQQLLEDNKNEKIAIDEFKPKDYLDRLNIKYNDNKVVINCYNGKKTYVQGKNSVLFQRLISVAIEKLPTDNAVMEILNTYHALTIGKSELENAFSELLPDFPQDNRDIKLRNTLLSATFNTLLTGYMPDYTCLVMPLFRAMEFYLHRILHDRLGHSTTHSNGGNNFNFFKPNDIEIYEYKFTTNNLNSQQIDYLNELYNNYKRVRHPFFHWSQNSIDTPVITDIETAREILKDGLQLINNYYKMF